MDNDRKCEFFQAISPQRSEVGHQIVEFILAEHVGQVRRHERKLLNGTRGDLRFLASFVASTHHDHAHTSQQANAWIAGNYDELVSRAGACFSRLPADHREEAIAEETDQLFGAKIKITVIEQAADGSRTRTEQTFYQYRWMDIVDANQVKNEMGDTAAFMKTFADGTGNFVQQKFLLARIPAGVTTRFETAAGPFNVTDPGAGPLRDVLWHFDPATPGAYSQPVTIHVNDPDLPNGGKVGQLTATGKAIGPTKLSVNLDDPATGYKAELKRVLLSLRNGYTSGADEAPGVANVDDDGVGGIDNFEEYGYPGSDDVIETLYDHTGNGVVLGFVVGPDGKASVAGVDDDGANGVDDPGEMGFGDDINTFAVSLADEIRIASSAFHLAFTGFMPSDRQGAGPDAVLGTLDDVFTPAQLAALDAKVSAEADALLAEVIADFEPIIETISIQRVNAGADVVMEWKELGADLFGGTSKYDYDLAKMQELIGTYGRTDPMTGHTFTAIIPDVAQKWAMAGYLNLDVADTGNFAVGINIDFTNPSTTFAQYVANTVIHELGHTFGLNEGYLPDDPVAGSPTTGGTGQVRDDSNAFPYDIMSAGGPGDPNMRFKDPTIGLLKLATGIADNSGFDNSAELKMWRDNFNLANPRKHVDGIPRRRHRGHKPATRPGGRPRR